MTTTEDKLFELAREIGVLLAGRCERMVSAESCTGGWIAKVVTDVAGSSEWFERGLVTYSNEAKQAVLGVHAGTIAAHGAVSEATVLEMAAGALVATPADWAVAVSGVAGPGGGTSDKPVGLVWLAWARRDWPPSAERLQFTGDRWAIRVQAVEAALAGLLRRLREQ